MKFHSKKKKNPHLNPKNLFYNLSLKTHACGTVHPWKGLLQEIASAKSKVCGESITMSYDNKIVAHHTLDRKHVTLVSTAYNAQVFFI